MEAIRKETFSIRWEHVDWDARVLSLPEEITKTRKARRVGLGQRLFYELLKRREKSGPVFPPLCYPNVSAAVTKHFARCGIKARLHDARHTYSTMIQEAGARIHQAMQRTGHMDPRTLAKYTHVSVDRIFEDEFEFMKVPEGGDSEA